MLLLKNNLSAPITYWIKICTDYCGSITLINSNTLHHFNPALFPYSALSLQLVRATPLNVSHTFLHLPLSSCYIACTLPLRSLFLSVYPSPSCYLSTTFGDCKGEKLGMYPGDAAQKGSLCQEQSQLEEGHYHEDTPKSILEEGGDFQPARKVEESRGLRFDQMSF